jgi:plasmid maintenance system antidote protein VapI
MSIQHDRNGSSDRAWRPRRQLASAEWVDPAVWQREDMRRALALHDIATVYRLLQRFGASQRQIAARTDQSQSEISEILGGRKVVSYDVLVRISEGLDVPRGWMGLAHSNGSLMTEQGPVGP